MKGKRYDTRQLDMIRSDNIPTYKLFDLQSCKYRSPLDESVLLFPSYFCFYFGISYNLQRANAAFLVLFLFSVWLFPLSYCREVCMCVSAICYHNSFQALMCVFAFPFWQTTYNFHGAYIHFSLRSLRHFAGFYIYCLSLPLTVSLSLFFFFRFAIRVSIAIWPNHFDTMSEVIAKNRNDMVVWKLFFLSFSLVFCIYFFFFFGEWFSYHAFVYFAWFYAGPTLHYSSDLFMLLFGNAVVMVVI